MSCSRDKTIRVWNILGDEKHKIDNAHDDWATCVRYLSQQDVKQGADNAKTTNNTIVSVSTDGTMKVWDLNKVKPTHRVTELGSVNVVVTAPDGSLVAMGTQEGKVVIWHMDENAKIYDLDCGAPVHCLAFSPEYYWIVVGTDKDIRIYDIEDGTVKYTVSETTFNQDNEAKRPPSCHSIAWNAKGDVLFAGFSDTKIRSYILSQNK